MSWLPTSVSRRISLRSSPSTTCSSPARMAPDGKWRVIGTQSERTWMSASADEFLFLCRCLSVDDCPAAVSALQEEIRTGEIDWRRIAELAADHFLTPALWVS